MQHIRPRRRWRPLGEVRRVVRTLLNPLFWLNLRIAKCRICRWLGFFLPYGRRRAKRWNAQCPCCGALERHRLLWAYLTEDGHDVVRPGARLLHFAPEPVLADLLQQAEVAYESADLCMDGVDHQVDLTALPFEDDSYDVIVCNHVLEHVEDDAAAMRELYRVLRPGGRGVVMVPLDCGRPGTFQDPAVTTREERRRVYLQHDHLRIYGRDFGEHLRAAGFQVEAWPGEPEPAPAPLQFVDIVYSVTKPT